MKFKYVFLVLQVFLLPGVFVDAIRCYDPVVGNDTIKICEEAYPYGPEKYACYRMISLTPVGYATVSVGCHPEEDADAFCDALIRHGALACRTCTVDLCNSSNGMESINVMFVILILFSTILRF